MTSVEGEELPVNYNVGEGELPVKYNVCIKAKPGHAALSAWTVGSWSQVVGGGWVRVMC